LSRRSMRSVCCMLPMYLNCYIDVQ
jgi:hypothetical protein